MRSLASVRSWNFVSRFDLFASLGTFSSGSLVCLATVLGSFLLPAATGILESNEKASFGLAGLAGAAVVGLMAIPVRLWHQRKHLRLWGGFAILSLALVLVVFLSYAYLKDSWSLQYAGKTVITGSTYVRSVLDYKRENPQYSDLQLLEDAAGNSSLVWTPDSIRTHRHILAGLYIASLPAFAIFLVSLAQAVYCADRKGTRSRVPEIIEPPKKPSVVTRPARHSSQPPRMNISQRYYHSRRTRRPIVTTLSSAIAIAIVTSVLPASCSGSWNNRDTSSLSMNGTSTPVPTFWMKWSAVSGTAGLL